jgi:hypothetical protein
MSDEVELKKLEIEELKLDLEELKLDNASELQEQKHIAYFDIRAKVFTVIILIIIVGAIGYFKWIEVLSKEDAKTILIVTITLGISNNTQLISKVIDYHKRYINRINNK